MSFRRIAHTTLCLASGSLLGYAALLRPAVEPAAKAASKTGAAGKKARAIEKIEYNRDVRPILSEKCFSCHGHDPKAVAANLKLNIYTSAYSKLRDGARAIVPFHPELSELVKRTTSKDPGYMMPPPDSNRTLTDEQRATLRAWIAQGAVYKPHWGFIEPVRYPAPPVREKGWVRNPIDAFVLADLEKRGMRPSPRADRATLLRRASLDITGLPPTPQELDAFLADRSPDAYDKQVDRLLASPRYAERMAMDWMDYARYADSNGYQSDWERFQWRWRDWVIDAFNKNLPYNEFIIKQLAGDLLPNATLDDVVATGFNRNHRINTEGGVIPEEWRVENVIDRVSTTATVFLGLTAGCARCHDHKYDPLTQKDFYSLYAYFNNVPETGSGVEAPVDHRPYIKAPTTAQEGPYFAMRRELDRLQGRLNVRLVANQLAAQSWKLPAPDTRAVDAATVSRFKLSNPPACVVGGAPAPKVVGRIGFAPGRSTGAVVTDGTDYVDLGQAGDVAGDKPFTYSAWIKPEAVQGSPLSRMDVANGYRGWDIFLGDGKVAAHIIHSWPSQAIKVIGKTMVKPREWVHVAVAYDGSGKAAGVKLYLNGKLEDVDVAQDTLTGSIATPVTTKVGTRTGADGFKGEVDDVRILNRAIEPADAAALAGYDPARRILDLPLARRDEDQQRYLSARWSAVEDPVYQKLVVDQAAEQKKFDAFDKNVTTEMIMSDMPQPRQAHVLIRGLYDHPGPKVFPRLPAFLPNGVPHAPPNRLGLAEWIASPENPLTARVEVNRLWERCFGVGIVDTPEDFGTRADFPTHPKLLDWMATEFVRLNWNMKAMFREILTSSAYMQSSKLTPELAKLDPLNKLISRGARFRLPAEVIRDQAIFESGMLAEKLGGPSVRPYQPKGVWDDVSFYGNLHHYQHDVGPNLHRRSLYTIWKRTAAPPEMTVFDAPSREVCTVDRARTDTPLQALVLLDDETFIEAGRALAQKAFATVGPSPKKRIAYMFRSMVARDPTPAESRILLAAYDRHYAHYRKDHAAAVRLINIGDWPTEKVDPAALAAYTLVGNLILNLDETITKD